MRRISQVFIRGHITHVPNHYGIFNTVSSRPRLIVGAEILIGGPTLIKEILIS